MIEEAENVVSLDEARVGSKHWAAQLIRRFSASGLLVPICCADNVVVALEGSTSLQGLFTYNTRAERVELTRCPPWGKVREGVRYPRPASDADIEMLRSAVSGPLDGSKPSSMGCGPTSVFAYDTVYRAVEHLSTTKASYDPILRYLDKLEWDGVPRLEDCIIRHLGAEESLLTRMITRRWFISAVRRARRPGCQADLMLILGGAQGIGKTTFLRLLFGKYHSEDFPDLDRPYAAISLQGAWCVEASELAAFNRPNIFEALKRFLTSVEDKIRKPYGRMIVSLPRMVVFAATTNVREWNNDPSGARRFMPIDCLRLDLLDREALLRERDQLWAEACHYEKLGEPHFITDAEFGDNDGALRTELKERHESARPQDTLTDRIGEQLTRWNKNALPEEVFLHQLMASMEIKDGDLKRMEKNFAASLTSLGYVKSRSRSGESRIRCWTMKNKKTASPEGPTVPVSDLEDGL